MHTIFLSGTEPFAISVCITFGLAFANLCLMAFHKDASACKYTTSTRPSEMSQILRFAGFGKVKAMIIVTNWFGFFGLSGYAIQALSQNISGNLLPLVVAVPLAMIIAFLLLGGFVALLIFSVQE